MALVVPKDNKVKGGQSHSTDPLGSKVPHVVQDAVPESVERALPESKILQAATERIIAADHPL